MDDNSLKYLEITNPITMSFNEIKDRVKILKDEYNSFRLSEEEFRTYLSNLANDSRKNVLNLLQTTFHYIDKRKMEIARVKEMYKFDLSYLADGYICGTDEVGRGPLAGPIVAASVILNLKVLEDKELLLGVKDSKKLSPKLREELAEVIKSKALCYNIYELDNSVIDKKGIAWCNNEVLKSSSTELRIKPNLILSDGYRVKGISIANEFIIKGDAQSASIACASIIAKVHRDRIMKDFSKIYGQYGFEDNSGYGSKDHIEAIKKFGPCKIHRMSFLTNIL